MTPVAFMRLFAEFRAPSWDAWRTILARVTPEVRALYVAAGRGSGKSRIVSVLAAWAGSREYRRAPGENIYVGVFGPDRKQAGITFRYVIGLLKSEPTLAALIVKASADSVELANGVIVEVVTATTAAPRGRSYAMAIVEEAAFLPQDGSANPDLELLRAVRPALARVPGSLLVVVSSPYARRGILWTAKQKHDGKPDGEVLFVQASTSTLNPMFDAAAIASAYEDDPVGAASEYGAEFRTDIESFVSPDVLADVAVKDRHELPPLHATEYFAFVDPAGGSGTDSMTLAIGHSLERNGHTIAAIDAVREVRPKFSPESVVADFALLLNAYRVTTVVGDRYAGQWPREAFRRHGIDYELADKSKSDLYRDLLPILNSGHIELLDDSRLLVQLQGLERRTARGGRDSIDHAPGGHDDLANVVAGVASIVALDTQPEAEVWGREAPSPIGANDPEVYVGRYRVRESDVRLALTSSGDLHLYDAGRISKHEAYRMTAVGLTHLEGMRLWWPPAETR